MKKYKGLLVRLLMNRAQEDVTTSSLKSVSKEIADPILAVNVASQDLGPLMCNAGRVVPMIHYSWIDSMLASVDKGKKKAFLGVLGDEQRKGIAKLSNAPPEKPLSADLLRKFYLKKLYPLLGVNEILPIEYLPDSSFNKLLKLQKNQLIELIDLMGLYDLAHEVRQIVATKHLKDVYKSLTAKQQQFLRQCLHAKDKVLPSKLHLEKWDGAPKNLMRILHMRGLARFSVALSGQHPDLIWYLAHMLDTGRGQLLLNQVKESEVKSLSSAVALQVDSAYSFAFQEEGQKTK